MHGMPIFADILPQQPNILEEPSLLESCKDDHLLSGGRKAMEDDDAATAGWTLQGIEVERLACEGRDAKSDECSFCT